MPVRRFFQVIWDSSHEVVTWYAATRRFASSLPLLTVTVRRADLTVLPAGIKFCVSNFRNARRLYSRSLEARVASTERSFFFA